MFVLQIFFFELSYFRQRQRGPNTLSKFVGVSERDVSSYLVEVCIIGTRFFLSRTTHEFCVHKFSGQTHGCVTLKTHFFWLKKFRYQPSNESLSYV